MENPPLLPQISLQCRRRIPATVPICAHGGKEIPPHLKSDQKHQPYRFQSVLTMLNNGDEELKSWKVFVGFQHDEYLVSSSKEIPHHLKSDQKHQPYMFQSVLTVLNNGEEELKSWKVFVGFQHDEYLVSASNVVITDGGVILPASVGNDNVFAGYPQSDLKTGFQTVGDLTQMSVHVEMVGTQFEVKSPDVPMPSNVSLVNDGFAFPKPSMQGNSTMEVCCVKDPNVKASITIADENLPQQKGDFGTPPNTTVRAFPMVGGKIHRHVGATSVQIHQIRPKSTGGFANWWEFPKGRWIFEVEKRTAGM